MCLNHIPKAVLDQLAARGWRVSDQTGFPIDPTTRRSSFREIFLRDIFFRVSGPST
jgi:hypothetical protein